MSTWECRECTAAYAPGAPACPQCGTNDPIKEAEQLEKEREQMPKITVHGGPSNADAEEPAEVEAAAVTDEAEADTAEAAEAVEPGPVEEKPKPASRAGRRKDSTE